MIVDCGIDLDFNVIFCKCFLFIEIDDVSFHIDDVNSVCERVKIL